MNPQYPCKICKNEVKDKDSLICCDICNMWNHIECVNIKPIKNWKMMMYLFVIRLKDKKTKNIPFFKYYKRQTKSTPPPTPPPPPSHPSLLKLLLSSLNLNFDITCILESRITKSNLPTSNIHIPGYNIEQIPTESSAGGSLIYISQKLSYKNRYDLRIYHSKHLKSTFIEILLPDKSSCIVGTVYMQPPMKSYSFNTTFSQLLQKIKK